MGLGELLIVLAGIIWTIELIPQLKKTIRMKKSNELSLMFFVMCSFAYVSYISGNAILKNWVIVLAHIPSFVLNLVMVYLIVKYRQSGKRSVKV